MKKLLSLVPLFGLFTQVTLANEPSTAPTQPNTQNEQSLHAIVAQKNQVNINTATAAEIQDKLLTIGAKKAQAIVEYREKNGKFVSVEQLLEVSGIGKATLDKNRDRIVLE